jgi:hypothetical protein
LKPLKVQDGTERIGIEHLIREFLLDQGIALLPGQLTIQGSKIGKRVHPCYLGIHFKDNHKK